MLGFVLELFVFLLVIFCVIRTYFSDCDALLNFYEVFGPAREKSLGGKVVWITGASSGIGENLSYELARCGCKLVLSARRKDELDRVKNRCLELAQEYHLKPQYEYEKDFFVLPLDLTKYSTHSDLVSSALQEFGKIDILINNAGIYQRGNAMKTWLEYDQLVMAVNIIGTISLTKALLPHMVKRNSGQIVVISSASGRSGAPGISAYTASKHALQGYFNTLRMEVHKSNVGVTLVCPGLVYSNILKNALQENPQICGNAEFPPTTIETKRCVYLITVAMANRLDEVWIAIPSRLADLYLQQYLPLLFSKWERWKYKRTK